MFKVFILNFQIFSNRHSGFVAAPKIESEITDTANQKVHYATFRN